VCCTCRPAHGVCCEPTGASSGAAGGTPGAAGTTSVQEDHRCEGLAARGQASRR